MDRLRLASLVFFAAAAAGFAPSCAAQASEAEPSVPYPVRPLPSDSTIPYRTKLLPKVENLSSFTGDTSHSPLSHLIAYRTQEEMSAADRALAASTQPAIRNSAVQAGMDFDHAQWTYRQLDCQSLPNHLFLLFEMNGGAGDVSLFSVSIPRSGSGHLRIIPVERRGFTLFSPAPVNSLAIAMFNRIRAEEPKGPPVDWLAPSLCYAALTASHGEIALSPPKSADANLALSFPPSLELGQNGESTVRFVNVGSASQPMQWALTYDAGGQLLRVAHFPAPVYVTRIIPKN